MVREPVRLPRLKAAAGLLALAALLCAPPPSLAVFVREEADLVDSEPLFDAEYFLDLLAFSYPLSWDRRWDRSERGLRMNAASLDRTDLLLDQELRLPQRLNEWLGFRYDLVRRGDKDLDALQQRLSLDLGPWKGLSAGLFGEPSFAKQASDIGLRLAWSPAPLWSCSGSVAAVDFDFNARGKTDARYDRKPYTYALSGAYRAGTRRLRAALELDSPLVLQFPDADRSYAYRRTRLDLLWEEGGRQEPETSGDWLLRTRYSYEYQRETDRYLPDPSDLSQDFRREAHTLTLAGSRWSGADELEAGARGILRDARSTHPASPSADRRRRRWEAMPYCRWRRRLRPWAVSETAFFLSAGENRAHAPAGAPSDLRTPVRAKLGLGVDFPFAERGVIGLNSNFDLVDATRHPWDGGNVRAMFLF